MSDKDALAKGHLPPRLVDRIPPQQPKRPYVKPAVKAATYKQSLEFQITRKMPT